jgi:hypothetical protein
MRTGLSNWQGAQSPRLCDTMAGNTLRRRWVGICLTLLWLAGSGGCQCTDGVAVLAPHVPCMKRTSNAPWACGPCYGYHPTCWMAWRPCCGICPPPGADIAPTPGGLEVVPVPQEAQSGVESPKSVTTKEPPGAEEPQSAPLPTPPSHVPGSLDSDGANLDVVPLHD